MTVTRIRACINSIHTFISIFRDLCWNIRAKTKAELEEIIKPSTPRYSGGAFYPGSLYHVDEEELILWSKTSLKAPLISQGYKRYQELFEKYVKEEARNEAA